MDMQIHLHDYYFHLQPSFIPASFANTINANVAQALGLNIADEANLRRSMLGEGGK